MASSTVIILIIAASAIVAAVPFVRGALGRAENPRKVLGARIRLSEIDGLGPEPPEAMGVIESFDGAEYRLRFEHPLNVSGARVSAAAIRARHRGYPVSSAGRLGVLAVAGRMESGAQFIGTIKRA
jgi:hypothetical protein